MYEEDTLATEVSLDQTGEGILLQYSKVQGGPLAPGPLLWLWLWLKRTKEETEGYLVYLVWVKRTGSTFVSLCEFL